MSNAQGTRSRWRDVLFLGQGPEPLSYFPILLAVAAGPMLGATIPSETRAADSATAEMLRQGMGGSSMWEPQTGSLLVEYYEVFLRDRDLDQFRDRVLARYTEGRWRVS